MRRDSESTCTSPGLQLPCIKTGSDDAELLTATDEKSRKMDRVGACGLDATTPGETESGAKAPILPGEWRWRARTDHGWLAFFKFGIGAFFAISAIASLALCLAWSLPRRRRIDTESSGLRFGSGRFCDAGFAADDEC